MRKGVIIKQNKKTMLISTMTPKEIREEVYKDYRSIIDISLNRLTQKYNRERKKLKVRKESTFQRFYSIKTKNKNPWLIAIGKAPIVEKYKKTEDMHLGLYVYYYTSKGIRVFKPNPNVHDFSKNRGLVVYNSHLFTRYRERMGLSITDPLEIIKRYFTHNAYLTASDTIIDGRQYTLSKVKEGYVLGEIQEEGWFWAQKTFITEDQSFDCQDEVAQQLMSNLQKNLNDMLYEPQFRQLDYEFRANIMKGIM